MDLFQRVGDRLHLDVSKIGGTDKQLNDDIGRQSQLYNDALHDLTKVCLITVTRFNQIHPSEDVHSFEMSPSIRHILSGVTRSAVSRRILSRDATSAVGLDTTRALSLSTQTAAKPADDDGSVRNAPIKFSTSKGGPGAWKVTHSLGSKHQRPWWKALPISLIFISVLLWSTTRNETDIDEKLGEHLLTKLPGLLPEEEEDENS